MDMNDPRYQPIGPPPPLEFPLPDGRFVDDQPWDELPELPELSQWIGDETARSDPLDISDMTVYRMLHQSPEAFVSDLQRTVRSVNESRAEADLELVAVREAARRMIREGKDFARQPVIGATLLSRRVIRAAEHEPMQLRAIVLLLNQILAGRHTSNMSWAQGRIFVGPESDFQTNSVRDAAVLKRAFFTWLVHNYLDVALAYVIGNHDRTDVFDFVIDKIPSM
jgi:hypothetical protein